MPLHADIQVAGQKTGLDCLTPILWQKIANGVTEAEGKREWVLRQTLPAGGHRQERCEYILFLRKGGDYRSPLFPATRALHADQDRDADLAPFVWQISAALTRAAIPRLSPLPWPSG